MIILLIIFVLFNFIRGEYEIKETVIPSYLNMTFYDLPETIFPYDIKMSMSLSRVTGTLLYSIDSNDNQLIVNLNDVDQPSLNIEFSKQHSHVSLLDLCGCKRCRYENITLRIQMRDSIYLQCNEGKTEVLKYERTKMFNKDYPVPNFNKTDKLKAHLWLVNTPYFEDLYPNNDQLYGCIFDIWYNKKIIKMDSLAVGNKCRKTCTPGICHSGECLETYNKYPVCNCTASFNNGRFCNDNMTKQNYEIIRQFQFRALKLSFNSVSGDFFQLQNERVSLKLSAKDKDLILVLNFNVLSLIKTEATLSQNYQKEDYIVIIMEFRETFMTIKLKVNESSWIFNRIPHFHDLSREIFNKLTLESKEGIIDMVYKNDLTGTKFHGLSFEGDQMRFLNNESNKLDKMNDLKNNSDRNERNTEKSRNNTTKNLTPNERTNMNKENYLKYDDDTIKDIKRFLTLIVVLIIFIIILIICLIMLKLLRMKKSKLKLKFGKEKSRMTLMNGNLNVPKHELPKYATDSSEKVAEDNFFYKSGITV